MPKGIKANIDYDAVYNSQYDGEYKIIEDLGHNEKGYHKVNIQFLETSNIQEAILYRAQRGQVRDQKKRIPDFDKIYQSNSFGPFKFLELLGLCGTDHNRARIQFIETGTIRDVTLSDAFEGTVRDPFRPVVCGFGYIGNASSKCREYTLWLDMITRCYNPNNVGYPQYGAKGVTVCDRWRSFEVFLEDVKLLPGYDLWLNNPGMYQIDKDIRQMGIPEYLKVYSPETCCFVDQTTNMKYAAKYHNEMDKSRTSKHMGVSRDQHRENYRVATTINQHKRGFGTYLTEVAAAAMYNKVTKFYYPDIDPNLLNDVPDMSMDEIQAQRVGGKNMCNTVNKEMCKIIHK